jgi:uncharacterized repeat protein (TIGR02543 family)
MDKGVHFTPLYGTVLVSVFLSAAFFSACNVGELPLDDVVPEDLEPRYNVTVESIDTELGSISASVKKAKKGEAVTVNANINAGYILNGFTGTYDENQTVNFGKVVGKGDNWQFLMPAADITIYADVSEGESIPTTNNPDLKAIDLSNDAYLNEQFSKENLDYTVTVSHKAATISIVASTADFYAATEFSLNGTAVQPANIPLNYGENTITIQVNPSEEGAPSKTYTLTITRWPNLDLKTLAIYGQPADGGTEPIKLSNLLEGQDKKAVTKRTYTKTVHVDGGDTSKALAVTIIAETDDTAAVIAMKTAHTTSASTLEGTGTKVSINTTLPDGVKYNTNIFTVSKTVDKEYTATYTLSICWSDDADALGEGTSVVLMNNHDAMDDSKYNDKVIIPGGQTPFAYIEAAGTPRRDGYKFTGWYTERVNGELITSNTSYESAAGWYGKKLYARWEFTGFEITFDTDGAESAGDTAWTRIAKGDSGDGSQNPKVKPEDFPDPKPKRTNYMFDGWYTEKNGGGTRFTKSTKVDKSTKVYAKWEPVYAGWTYDSSTGGMTKKFSSTKSVQEVTLPLPGKYQFKLWGANGGNGKGSSGGVGGYASGSLQVSADNADMVMVNQKLYIYVGATGGNGGWSGGGGGGWNGGGAGGNGVGGFMGGGGGGGATDVRIGINDNNKGNLNTRIIVAGGGGGGANNNKNGGAGGGVSGGLGDTKIAAANQTSGCQFGIGAQGGNGVNASTQCEGRGGGGGGYWGGNAVISGYQYGGGSGGGGSGFVYGYETTPGDSITAENQIPTEYAKFNFTDDFACALGNASSKDRPANPGGAAGYVVISYLTNALSGLE